MFCSYVYYITHIHICIYITHLYLIVHSESDIASTVVHTSATLTMVEVGILLARYLTFYISQCRLYIYRKTSNIKCTLVDNKIVDHSDVVGASPVGAAPTTSSFSTSHLASSILAKTAARQYENLLSVGIWCALCYRLDGIQQLCENALVRLAVFLASGLVG